MTPRRTSLVLIMSPWRWSMAWGFSERRMVLLRVAGSLLVVSKIVEAENQGPHARWVDDYYTVEELGERSFAIGEPRYWQQNFSYLIVGSERALVFDAGPGVRDIRPIAESLTDLPITFVPSHLHLDHLATASTSRASRSWIYPICASVLRTGVSRQRQPNTWVSQKASRRRP